MEEDLERLEKTIKDYKEHVEFSEEIEEIDKNMKALENLIAGYKELERKLTPTPDNAVPLEYQTAMYVDKRGYVSKDKVKEKIDSKFKEAKGLYERGVQPQAQYTMKLLRDLEKKLIED